jgi:integrase
MERKAQVIMRADSPQAQQVQAIFARVGVDIERERFSVPSAHKYVTQLVKIATGEDLTRYSLESWCEEWLRRKGRGRKEGDKTMLRYRKHVAKFLDRRGDKRKKPLESVTSEVVREWCEELRESGLTGVTVKNHAKDLGAIYRGAIREGVVSFNPWESVIAEIGTDDSMSRRPFEMDEIRELIKAAPSREWKGLILVAAFTGLRLGDAAGLLWKKVNLKTEEISLIPAKTRNKKREVSIPIQEDLLEYLKALPEDDVSPERPILPTLANKKIHGSKGLSNTFTNEIMLKAAVSRGNASREIKEGESKGKGRIIYERGFHSLKHTFISWLREADVSEEDRMALVGHTTREVHKTYSHVKISKLRDAIEKLPGLTKRAKKATASEFSTSEISNIAASLPTGSPEERAKNAQLIIEAVKRNTQLPPTIMAWHETVPLAELLEELMPFETPEDRSVRYCSFLMWLVKRQLKDEIDAQKIDNTQFGIPTPDVTLTEAMVMNLFRRTIEEHSKDGVMEAPAFAEKFKQWSAANSRKRK